MFKLIPAQPRPVARLYPGVLAFGMMTVGAMTFGFRAPVQAADTTPLPPLKGVAGGATLPAGNGPRALDNTTTTQENSSDKHALKNPDVKFPPYAFEMVESEIPKYLLKENTIPDLHVTHTFGKSSIDAVDHKCMNINPDIKHGSVEYLCYKVGTIVIIPPANPFQTIKGGGFEIDGKNFLSLKPIKLSTLEGGQDVYCVSAATILSPQSIKYNRPLAKV